MVNVPLFCDHICEIHKGSHPKILHMYIGFTYIWSQVVCVKHI